ncbi:MAG: response regulator transcription factor [Campylobacteraceae bacterium]
MESSLLNRLKNTSILVVEDDEIALFGIEQGLKNYCKSFYSATDGLDGIEIYKKNQIDIIITDIHLPVLNGFDMIREILTINPTQKFIVMTSYDSDKNISKSINEGACLFLKKPIQIENLQIQLLHVIGKDDDEIVKLSNSISVNPKRQIIYKNSEILSLSYKSNSIFWLLFNNLNKTVHYDVIESYIYENEEASKNAIRMAISRVADIIGKDLIKNISGVGYMMKIS